MRLFIATFIAAFALCTVAEADITSHLVTYKPLNCSFKKRQRANKVNHAPHFVVDDESSTNWSGYAAVTNANKPANGSVTVVNGTWQVPQLVATSNDSYSAIWVGIDGFSSSSVEQLGTEHDWSGGSQQNYAWFEMYPNPSYEIEGFPLNVGDVIQAEVVYEGNNQFVLSMVNHTQGAYAVVPSEYTYSRSAKRSSAEWIVEAPYSNEVLPLAHFDPISFVNCTTSINGVTGGIANQNWQAIDLTMITNNDAIKAVPSSLSSNDENFTVTWEHE